MNIVNNFKFHPFLILAPGFGDHAMRGRCSKYPIFGLASFMAVGEKESKFCSAAPSQSSLP
jgi:hypothetical protein